MERTIIAFQLLWLLMANAAWAGEKKAQAFRWDRVLGIDANDFKEEFLARVADKLERTHAYGGCDDSVAACLRKNRFHKSAGRLARDIFLLMASQSSDEGIAAWIEKRKKMAHPDPKDIRSCQLDGLTPLGDPKAPVVVVEYSDFQCPFCAMIAPVLEEIVREKKGKVRLYFKQFPIKSHPRALPAARACVAADAFGKFWEYCPKLFLHQSDLSDERLLALAEETGVDVDRFKREMAREETFDRIADEKMEGLKNRVKATPTIFINGKEFLLRPTRELLRDRIEEELDILNGTD